MSVSHNTLMEALFEGEYDLALEGFEKLRTTGVKYDWLSESSRGTALMCLRRYEEAAGAFDEANRMATEEERQRLKRIGQFPSSVVRTPYLEDLGAAHWLAGKRKAAIEAWQRAVRGVLDGSIAYTDGAGGVSQGLFLLYAATAVGRTDIRQEAEKYLANRAKRKRIEQWPGPLALLALAKKDAATILFERFATTDIAHLVSRAADDLLTRRELCQFLFHHAATLRAQGRENTAHELFHRCAALRNPVIEIEWYLARGEAEKT